MWGLVKRYASRLPIRASSDRLREAFKDTEDARLRLVDKIALTEDRLVTQQQEFEKQLEEQRIKCQDLLDKITKELELSTERGRTLERIMIDKTMKIDALNEEIRKLTLEIKRLTVRLSRKPKPPIVP